MYDCQHGVDRHAKEKSRNQQKSVRERLLLDDIFKKYIYIYIYNIYMYLLLIEFNFSTVHVRYGQPRGPRIVRKRGSVAEKRRHRRNSLFSQPDIKRLHFAGPTDTNNSACTS